jgi:hypothetical protein
LVELIAIRRTLTEIRPRAGAAKSHATWLSRGPRGPQPPSWRSWRCRPRSTPQRAINGVVVVLLVVLFAACARPPVRWTKPDGTEAQFRVGAYECRRDAQMARPVVIPAGRGGIHGVIAQGQADGVARSLYDQCLAARGWKQDPRSP